LVSKGYMEVDPKLEKITVGGRATIVEHVRRNTATNSSYEK